jgi:hypothetical protein
LGQNVLDICRAKAPDKEFALHTFFGPRGINSFEDCQALFILGCPIPNIRDAWVELSTNWELIQCLHRIRPVHKKSTELVFAADSWPICLPEPDEVKDESRDIDKPERLFKRLKIFFDELGFMNRDLALIAKVYQPGKTEKIYRQITGHLEEVNIQKGETSPRIGLFSPPLKSYPADTINEKGEAYLLNNTIGKHTLFEPTMLIVAKRLADHLCLAEMPVTARQLKAVLDQLEGDGGLFDRFTVKSGYGKGQRIAGVGLIDRVETFYKELNSLKSSPKTNMGSIVREAQEGEGYPKLPTGEIVVTFSEYAQDIIRLGYSNRMTETTPEGLAGKLGTIINEIRSDDEDIPVSIITTQGKLIAGLLIESDHKDIPIKDLTAIERVLKNNLLGFRHLTQASLMGSYEREAASLVIFKGLSDIWNLQGKAIKNDGLEKVMALEEKMLRVTADMERHGIGVDAEKLNEMIESHAFPQYEKAADAILGRIGPDGRFHDEIDFMGATSARLVSRLDNVPRKGPLRSFFRAREGYRFIVADYRQQEPRIMAGLSEDEALLEIFNTGKDLYASEAAAIKELLGIEVGRNVAKNIVNAINNMGSAYTVKRILSENGFEVELGEVKDYLAGYRQKFAALFSWQASLVSQARARGYIATELGRRRYIDESTGDSSVFNYAVQGTAADGFKMALKGIWEALTGIDAYIVHTMRDEVIVEAEKSVVEQVKGLVENCMKEAFAEMVPGVEFPVEIEVRESWGEAWPEEAPEKTEDAVEVWVP